MISEKHENVKLSLHELDRFVASWTAIIAANKASDEGDFKQDLINPLSIFLDAFPPLFNKYVLTGSLTNVWKTSGIKHDELKNCRVLEWLLDCNGDHGQGSGILVRLLDLLGKKHISSLAIRGQYYTMTESIPSGEHEHRVDIEIESKDFLIFIEAKVFAGETNNQLERYLEIASKKSGNRPYVLIYLTRNGLLPKTTSLQGEILPLTWSDVSRVLISHVNDNYLNTHFVGQVIRQFAKHIANF